MTTAWSAIELIIIVGVCGLAAASTVYWGRDVGVLQKLAAFPGILFSACPIVALALYVVCRRRAPRYADICAAMGIVGIVLGVVIYSGRVAFGVHG